MLKISMLNRGRGPALKVGISIEPLIINNFFFKGAQAGRQTWDLLVLIYFLSLKQRLRPLGYCAPPIINNLSPVAK